MQAAYGLAGLPLIYPSGGEVVLLVLLVLVVGGYAWHTRSALSSPQEINLFERAAGLKIGRSPKTIALGINCPVFARRLGRLRRGDARSWFRVCVCV